MPDAGIAICRCDALVDGGRGVRFALRATRGPATGFVVRHRGQVRAYLNRCAHVGIELDWRPGEFFDRDATWILCATHGATYAPETGGCTGGPCTGGLRAIAVEERDGGVFWFPDQDLLAPDHASTAPTSQPR